MFWAGFEYDVQIDLVVMTGDPTAKKKSVTSAIYRAVLDKHLPTLMNADFKFMQNNVSIYTAHIMQQYFKDNNIKLME
jgi:hypothetical protein